MGCAEAAKKRSADRKGAEGEGLCTMQAPFMDAAAANRIAEAWKAYQHWLQDLLHQAHAQARATLAGLDTLCTAGLADLVVNHCLENLAVRL